MLKFIYFITFFFIFPDFIWAKPVVISLGSDCQVAIALTEYNLRLAAYPFDWLVTEDFDSVIDAIQDNFTHWLNPQYLEYKNKEIFNSYYGISFVHDFPVCNSPIVSEEGDHFAFGTIDPNFLAFLSPARLKFERRIKRLWSILISTEPVIFIRTNATPSSAKRFVNLIKSRFPNLPFLLVVICPLKLLSRNWNIEGVRNFYGLDQSERSAWWWGNKTWDYVFKELNLYP